ncbi:hypothetical protein TNCV_1583411 [Trichonephila clavipes]|nr:hypothetical protein TNCV_1583411 [Trichonephila clavipes]
MILRLGCETSNYLKDRTQIERTDQDTKINLCDADASLRSSTVHPKTGEWFARFREGRESVSDIPVAEDRRSRQ